MKDKIKTMNNNDVLSICIEKGLEQGLITKEDVKEVGERLKKDFPNANYDLSKFYPKESED